MNVSRRNFLKAGAAWPLLPIQAEPTTPRIPRRAMSNAFLTRQYCKSNLCSDP